MDSREALKVLTDVGAFLKGHFVLVSGRHSGEYIDKDMLYPHVVETSRFCYAIAERFLYLDIDAVVAPEKGGIILSQWVAYWLTLMKHRKVLAFYAEKDDINFILKRGGSREFLPGKRVLVVEDLLTTGGSVLRVVRFLRDEIQCEVIGVGALCNRGNVTLQQVGNPARFECVMDITIETYTEDACPLCARKVSIDTHRGHGRAFLERQAA